MGPQSLLIFFGALSCAVQGSPLSPLNADIEVRVQNNKIPDSFTAARNQFIQKESHDWLGSDLVLSPLEDKVNNIIRNLKAKEYKEGIFNGGRFFSGKAHFFHTKPLIESSNIFKIIRRLPKGGALHVHETAAVDAEFIAKNMTHSPYLYYCSSEETFRHFYPNPPQKPCGKKGTDPWVLLSELRSNASSPEYFDKWLLHKFSLLTDTPEIEYADINVVWSKFEKTGKSAKGIIRLDEARRVFLTQALTEFYEDGIKYIEFRGGLGGRYRLNDQSELTERELLDQTFEIVQDFKAKHPDFIGIKYIYTAHKGQSTESVAKELELVINLQKDYPGFLIGFDLVGQEDVSNPILTYASSLLSASEYGVKYFFHAGETDWRGSEIDDNLLTSVLLNSSRIGHGYSLPTRPKLQEIIKKRQIGIEVCPISNQVLGLIEDYRNHPASALLKNGFPVVVSSDDPGTWGAKGLSHDWYIAFMALAGAREDIRFLKQLAINSIQLSGMSKEEKVEASRGWEKDWEVAMNDILKNFS